MGRFLFDPDPYAETPEDFDEEAQRQTLYGGGSFVAGIAVPGASGVANAPILAEDPYVAGLRTYEDYRWTTSPGSSDQWAQLAYRVKENYPNITSNAFIQRRVDQVAQDYMLETGAQATAYTLWEYPKFHQAMFAVNSGVWTLPTVYAIAHPTEPAYTADQTAASQAAAAAGQYVPSTASTMPSAPQPVLTYFYNSVYGPQQVDATWALMLSQIYSPTKVGQVRPYSGPRMPETYSEYEYGMRSEAGPGDFGPVEPGQPIYGYTAPGQWGIVRTARDLAAERAAATGPPTGPAGTHGFSFWDYDPVTGEGTWKTAPVGSTDWQGYTPEGGWEAHAQKVWEGAQGVHYPWAEPIPVRAPTLPAGMSIEEWAYQPQNKPSGVNSYWRFEATSRTEGRWVIDPAAVSGSHWEFVGTGNKVTIPTYSADEYASMLEEFMAATPTSGYGSKIAFDREEVKQYIEKLWRGYLMEQVPDETAYGMADTFIAEAISFYSQGGALDLEAWTVKKIHETPRYSMMFHHKPPDMEDLTFISNFQEVAGQIGVPEYAREGQITSAMSSGAGYQGYAEQAGRSAEVMGAFPGSFIQRLAKTGAESIGTLG